MIYTLSTFEDISASHKFPLDPLPANERLLASPLRIQPTIRMTSLPPSSLSQHRTCQLKRRSDLF